MAKLIYFTDTHVRGTTPENRLDNFVESLSLKFKDIVQISRDEKIDALLCGGDLFDRALLSPAVVREFTSILRQASVPIYINLGNHDELAHNPETVFRTMLGLVHSLATEFSIITSTEVKLKVEESQRKEGSKVEIRMLDSVILDNVEIFATPYSHGVDSNLQAHAIKKSSKALFTFHMIHSMLVEKPFIASHVLWEAVANVTEADVVFCSHFHPEQPLTKVKNTWFVAPGGLARLSAIPENFNRTPQIAIVDTSNDKLKIEYRKLPSAHPSEEIFDRASIQEGKDYQISLESFVESISLNQFQGENVESIVEAVARTQNLDSEVTQEALRRVAKARERREFEMIKG